MLKNTIFTTLLCGIVFILLADTIPGGDVSGTWYAANSPYYITGDITVQGGNSLQIEPAVDVIFLGNYELTIYGMMAAIGTQNDSILFTAEDTTTGWQGMNINNATDSIRISHSIIQYSNSSAVVCSSSALIISNTNLRNNSGGMGGGLSALLSYCRIHECEFSHNSAGMGGGLGIAGTFELSLTSTVFTHNVADGDGGAIWKGYGEISINIDSCEFISNTSGQDGGGIYFSPLNQSIVLSDLVFEHNVADITGGGVWIYSEHTTEFSNCSFSNDSAFSTFPIDFGGGGVCCWGDGNFIFRDCEFNDDYTGSCGGAIFSDDIDRLMIYDCDFTSNVAFNAGAVWAYQTHYLAEVTNSIFERNQGASNVAGVLFLDADTSILSYLTVVNNPDGGADLSGNYNTIENCTFHGNDPHALTISSGNEDILNTIFEGNTGESALHHSGGGSISISYSDFYNNPNGHVGPTAPNGFDSLVQVNYNNDSCDVYFNIFMDPMFEDTANGNYQLTAGSPCIDAGNPAYPLDPDSTICDIGAFWYDQTGIVEYWIIEHIKENDFLGATIFSGPLQLPNSKKLKVLDITGRVVDPNEITRGIYFIEIDGKVTEKVVKVR